MSSNPEKQRAKDERKRQKAIAKAEKERRKTDAKLVKAGVDPTSVSGRPTEAKPKASASERYADTVRGVLYLLAGGSLVLAVILGQRDAVLGLDDIIDNLFVATVGKIILVLIAIGLGIYGLKKLGLLKGG